MPLPAPTLPTSQKPGRPQGQPPQGQAPQGQPSGPIAMTGGVIPDQMRAMLQRMRAEVEKNCDYVGPDFADQARAMHRGEVEPKGIYGETTEEQAESLAEEGIGVTKIPWVPRADG